MSSWVCKASGPTFPRLLWEEAKTYFSCPGTDDLIHAPHPPDKPGLPGRQLNGHSQDPVNQPPSGRGRREASKPHLQVGCVLEL